MKVLKVEPYQLPEVKNIDSGLSSLQHEVEGWIEATYPFEDPVAIICPNRQTFVALQNETYVMRKEEVDALVQTASLSRQAILNRLRGANKDKSRDKSTKVDKKKDVSSGLPIESDADYKTYDIYDDDDSI